jgi:hypothetical protein
MKEGYTRITKVLSPFTGYKSIPQEILRAKADIGTRAHEVIRGFLLTGGLWDVDEDVKGYVESMKRFWGQGYPIKDVENRLYCEEHLLTGEPDLLFEGPKGLTLLDWKTSVKENATWKLQASGYAHLCKQNGHEIKDIWFIKLDKLGKEPEIFKYKKDIPLFMKCLEIYKMFFNKEENLVIEELIE